jgi:hypothetical protein
MKKFRRAFSIRPRTPTPLFFAIAAVPHAAPLPSVRLAGIDEIHLAVGCAALSDTAAIGRNEQGFDGERAGMQRYFRCGWKYPTVPDRV